MLAIVWYWIMHRTRKINSRVCVSAMIKSAQTEAIEII